MIGRRSLLLAGVALPTAAYGQCVTDTPAVDACMGGVRITTPPGLSLDLSFMTPGSLDGRITFTRASTATYFDAAGTMQTAASGAPRWDYNPSTHALNGLLIEEARTNSVLNSATLVTQSVTVKAVPWTLSFYGTGTVTLSGTSTGSLVGTGANNRVSLTFTPTAGTLTLTVTGSVTNAQLEAGGFITSWIPTAGAAATRAADLASMPTAAWFTAAGGTYQAEFIPNGSPSTLPSIVSGNAGSPVIALGGDARLATAIRNVVALLAALGPACTFGAVNKGALAYLSGASRAATNGTAFGPNAAAFSVTGTVVQLGSDGITPGANAIDGYLRRVRYWPRALSNAELQSVTT